VESADGVFKCAQVADLSIQIRRPAGGETVKEKNQVVVVGLGEVGKPLFELLFDTYNVVGVDISPPVGRLGNVDVMHICYPFQIKDFVGETARYVDYFKPTLTVINSTVAVGTTRKIAEHAGTNMVYSPVRGKHARMLADMRSYTKVVGALDPEAGLQAAKHFENAGLKTRILSSPEAAELGKLTETTYFGLMIAWAQEIERYCDQFGANYDEVTSLYEEIKFFPAIKYFPGVIGGHCVMPNIEILSKLVDSKILKAIQFSNQKKIERESGGNTAEGSKAVAQRSVVIR
jgi:UDP-N-acetyl-D-mannosaminuronate dehydrogenase